MESDRDRRLSTVLDSLLRLMVIPGSGELQGKWFFLCPGSLDCPGSIDVALELPVSCDTEEEAVAALRRGAGLRPQGVKAKATPLFPED